MNLACSIVASRFVSRLVLVTKFGVQNGSTARPIGGDAILQAGRFEVPTGRSPLHRVIGSLPVGGIIRESPTAAVKTAPGARLHALVVLRHVQIHLAILPQRPDDLRWTLGEAAIRNERPWTTARDVLICNPERRMTTDGPDRIQLA